MKECKATTPHLLCIFLQLSGGCLGFFHLMPCFCTFFRSILTWNKVLQNNFSLVYIAIDVLWRALLLYREHYIALTPIICMLWKGDWRCDLTIKMYWNKECQHGNTMMMFKSLHYRWVVVLVTTMESTHACTMYSELPGSINDLSTVWLPHSLDLFDHPLHNKALQVIQYIAIQQSVVSIYM